MAIKDKAVTIKGSEAKIGVLQVWPQADGSCVITVSGVTKDSEGRPVPLKEAQIAYRPGANDIIASLLAAGLDSLRKVNGLEDAAITLEPQADTAPVEVVAPKP